MVTIPKSLQPNKGKAKPLTEAEKKRVKQFGSLENYKTYQTQSKIQGEVEEEFKSLGLDKVSSVEDYKAKYEKASPTAKKYLETPASFSSRIKEENKQTIAENKVKIAEQIAFYQEKINEGRKEYQEKRTKYRDRGRDTQALEDKYDEKERYYKGIIEGLNKSKDTPTSFQNILSYAKELGRYERDREAWRNDRNKAKKEFKDKYPEVYLNPETGQGFSTINPKEDWIRARFDYDTKKPFFDDKLEFSKYQAILKEQEKKAKVPDTRTSSYNPVAFLEDKSSPVQVSKTGRVTFIPSNNIKIKPIKRDNQIYSSFFGGFIPKEEAYGTGGYFGQGTPIISPPTASEKAKFEELQFKGSIAGIQAGVKKELDDIKYSPFMTKITGSSFVQGFKGKSEGFESWIASRQQRRAEIDKSNEGTIFGRINKGASLFTTPEGAKTLIGDIPAEGTLRAGSFIANFPVKNAGLPEDSFFLQKTPLTRGQVKDTLSTFYLFSGFAPLMKTGTYQQQAYASDFVRVKYQGKIQMMTKEEAKRLGLKPLTRGEEVEALENYLRVGKSPSFSAKADKLRDLLRRASTPEQTKQILETAKNVYGEAFVKDFISQESSLVPIVTKTKTISILPTQTPSITPTVTSQTPSIWAGQGLYERTSAVGLRIGVPMEKIQFAESLGAGVDLFGTNRERTRTESKNKVLSVFNTDTIQDTSQDTNLISGLSFRQDTSPIFDTRTAQDTAQDTIQSPRLDSGLITTPKPVNFLPSPFGGGFGGGLRIEPPPETPFPRFFGLPMFRSQERTQGEDGRAYVGEVKEGGEWKQVTDKPHTKSGALSVIARVIDNTLSAQGRVRPAKKQPPKGFKLLRGDDYLDMNREKFRGFRIVKGMYSPVKDKLYEKRSYRIDTAGEKRGLSVSKYLAETRRKRAGVPRKRKASTRKRPFIL